MLFRLHYHQSAKEELTREIVDSLSSLLEKLNTEVRKGRATHLNKLIWANLKDAGWTGPVMLSPKSRISITGVKGKVGICLQTGNMGRMYADLLKLETLYLRGTIEASVMILMGTKLARLMGDNLADYDRLLRELAIFKDVIKMPLLAVGLDADRKPAK